MFKIELANEPQRTIEQKFIFDLRRHKQAEQAQNQEILYMTIQGSGINGELYPIVIDGRTKTVKIRKFTFSNLGFNVIIEQ